MANRFVAPSSWRRKFLKWGFGAALLLMGAWIVVNYVLPRTNPDFVLRKIDLPGAKVRAVAQLKEEFDPAGPDAWEGPARGWVWFHSPWMKGRADGSEGRSRYVTAVQWSFRSFLRSGTVLEKRVVLEAATAYACELCREEFLQMLPGEDAEGRALIARCLGMLGDADALTELEKLSTDPDEEVRMGVLRAVRDIEHENQAELLERVLSLIRRAMREDLATAVRNEAEVCLIFLRCYGREPLPALMYDQELVSHCPPEKRRGPLTEEIVREQLGRHLPHGLGFSFLLRDWKDDAGPRAGGNGG
ncbi:MAG TPA: HEAT repeat domain-containing protein [Verrucomicrobiales bacterium]|nr:HEAT repeat domain-containing protein [Verrucomicrobiales bacterium]